MDLTILTCNYNTPDLIINLVKSIQLTSPQIQHICIVNTGDVSNSVVIDGYKSLNLPNTPHGPAVNFGLMEVDTRYVLLVDSDVIFKKDVGVIFEKFKKSGCCLMGDGRDFTHGTKNKPRINPWFCFIDMDQCIEHDIKFYDFEKSKKVEGEQIYDIGSSFYEDIMACGLDVGVCDIEDKYYKHYEGMSWRVQKYHEASNTDIDLGGTHNNKRFHDYGLYVMEVYKRETSYLK